ncbi:glycosyltransferase family 39 protein [Thermoleptolyngbya sp. M55_K2018_002]|uniref:glycosyltransferase family 39 protein n=1 Tax=Thermoleptolyngbya sp. M55_K2018_002 TaxID=2747808 RepID=UPI0019EDDFCB|nr:glycosyltransferase family 39 protein [Thermoleptolyngbya sp. M55_K2018_002]HIK40071.1 glycosyltransferase family 39 protein [Thermoleptolyngbya sp. M55_K2018_002]
MSKGLRDWFAGRPWALLLLWMALAALVRFAYLSSKPPWTDEFSTLVFSLGHSFRTVPLDQVISSEGLLSPLRLEPEGTPQDVVRYLMSESTHPPMYFLLSHFWLKLFPALPQGIVSVWVGRSLSVVFAILTVPAIYGLGWLAGRSRLAANLSAILYAVSPYAVFLAQDARHYTLALLLITLSFCCLVVAVRKMQARQPIPLWLCAGWVAVNALGVAVHYFVMLSLLSEAIALLFFWRFQSPARRHAHPISSFLDPQLLAVAFLSLAACLVWLPELANSQTSPLTEWIFYDRSDLLMWLNPVFQFLAAWVVMVILLPLESDFLPLAAVAAVVMIAFLIWVVPLLVRSFKMLLANPQTRWAVVLLGGLVLGGIAVMTVITYGLGRDVTRGARYNFIYFPAVLALLGMALAALWNRGSLVDEATTPPPWTSRRWYAPRHQFPKTGKTAVLAILFLGFLSALSVAVNLGYEKYYRPEQLAAQMRQYTEAPILVATDHQTHVQTGEMMGLAREFLLAPDASPYTLPRFILAHGEKNSLTPAATLNQVLNQVPRPFDLWLVNWHASENVNQPDCTAQEIRKIWINGYSYDLYRCR